MSATVLDPQINGHGFIDSGHKNIKISSDITKSLYYYVDLTARFLDTEQIIDISGLGKAVSKVVATIETLKSKGVIKVEKIHTGLNSSVELVVTVSKGPNHTEYLKSMEERKGKLPSPSSSIDD